jgi:hypothetical protein
MIVAFELSFANVSNIKFQRVFSCLNDIIEFSFFSTIKNHLMLRYREIQKKLLRDLFNDDTKVSFFMNCWSFFNRQRYLVVIVYFIDIQWIYHEILLAFEHISDFHIEQKLTKVVQDVVVRHELKERLYVVTNDNAFKNLIMHTELNHLLRINRIFVDVKSNVRDVERVSCLAHVIQLILQKFLEKIKIKSNANFKTSWNDKQNKVTMKREKRDVSFTLAKVRKLYIWHD